MRLLHLFFAVVLVLSLSLTAFAQEEGDIAVPVVSLFNAAVLPDAAGPGGINSPEASILNVISGGSTSTNARAPVGQFRYQRAAWLITAAEMAAAGFESGWDINAIGFNYSVGQDIPTTGNPFRVYLENTSDATFIRGTSWATITASMSTVHDNPLTIPAAAGILDITFANGTPFTYTGGGLYIAFEYSNATDPISTNRTVLCNTALTNGLVGAQSGTSLPTTLAASSFRPWTRLGTSLNDIIQVPYVYALGKIPIPYGVPQVIKAPVINVSASPATFDLTITVKSQIGDTVRFTHTITGLNVPANTQQNVAFPPWTPTIAENDSIIVTTSAIVGEDIIGNNRAVMVQSVNTNRFSYSQGPVATGGVGFTGATGDFVARFSSGTSAVIDSIQVNFSAGGQTYQLGIWDATGPGSTPGTNLFTSSNYVSATGVQTIPVNPAVAVNGLFYLGVRQIGTTNVSFSFQNENPIRDSTFYYTSPTGGTTWTDFFTSSSAFRFMIEANIAPGFPMAYDSSTTAQASTAPVVTGSTSQQVLRIEVVTTGNLLPISATSFSLNTNGSTNAGTDISNATLYYTGASSTFAPVNQFGTFASPNGPFVINGSRSLVSGTNYFWLAYDIQGGATVGNVVDGECTSITVTGAGAVTPTVTAPAGNREIKNPLAAGDYTIGTTLFSRILGRDVTFQKSIRKVMREVPVAEENATRSVGEVATSPLDGMTMRLVEVEEQVWTLMDGNRPFEGRQRVEVTPADRVKYNLGESVLAVYPTITAALADLNALGIAGPVNFLLVDASYPSETYPLQINNVPGASATNTVTIRPQTSVVTTVSGSSSSAIFKLNGADYITIDGSNSGGTDRSMTIQNTNAAAGTSVIWIASVAAPVDSAHHNTVKNCVLVGGSPTMTLAGVVTSGATLGGVANAQNINNTIQNNAIRKSQYGIAAVGPTGNETGLLVTQNTIGGTDTIGFNGIAVFQQRLATVSNNTINNVITSGTGTTSGIRVSGTADSVLIASNLISNIRNTNTAGWGCNGIQLNSSVQTAKVTVANNFIWDVKGFGFPDVTVLDNAYGIIAVTGGPYRLYHNSINMNTNQDTVAGLPAALNIAAAITAGQMNVRNNVLANTQTTGNQRWAVYSASDTALGTINYNNYYTTGPNLGYLGSNRADLAAWQAATGQDANSVSSNPLFVSPTDLHITSGASAASNAGTPIATVTTDIDGDARSLSTPDIGADEFGAAPIGTAPIAGWNIISRPVSSPVPGDSVRQLFPQALFPYGFKFVPGSGYQQEYTMALGTGYWEKFPASPSVVTFNGTPLSTLGIPVVAGWNLIGSISVAVDTAYVNANSVPSNIVTTAYYGFGTGGYGSGDAQLLPGKGYWVKTNAAGTLNLGTAGPAMKQAEARSAVTGLNEITIRDASGHAQTLRFGVSADVNVEAYEMPPLPPAEAFDVRFVANNAGYGVMVHDAENATLPVSVQSASYPLTVEWNITSGSYELVDAAGNRTITGAGSMQITNPSVNQFTLRLGGSELPKEFALDQNYPNPFNPTTSIKFALPVESRVTVEVFNALGQRVRTLVSESRPAGYHVAEWNGTGNANQLLGSGVYFVRLDAQGVDGRSFTNLRKMLLLK